MATCFGISYLKPFSGLYGTEFRYVKMRTLLDPIMFTECIVKLKLFKIKMSQKLLQIDY